MAKICLKDFLKIPKENLYGKIFCFPTDTVYGLAALIDDEAGIQKIYKIKHREEKKPLAILTHDKDLIKDYVKDIPAEAKNLMEKYWPGPLTLIFEKSSSFIANSYDYFPTVAFRMPNSSITLELLKALGMLYTTSVNISGQAELNTPSEIDNVFGEQIDYIICDEVTLSKLPSTIIDATKLPLTVIRQGAVKI